MKCQCGRVMEVRATHQKRPLVDGTIKVYHYDVYFCRVCRSDKRAKNKRVSKLLEESKRRKEVEDFLIRVDYSRVQFSQSALVQSKMNITKTIHRYENEIRESDDKYFIESKLKKVFALKIIRKELVLLARQL